MADKLQSVRGMNDLLPPDSDKWRHFESHCRQIFRAYGYAEIRTPIVESTNLFKRGIGDATDIVEKEMYTFADRRDRSLTMRPEMTASCVRAYIQHGIGKREPATRWFYIGPMFRYERMQKGRYRQFFQIGVEAYGVAEPSIDAEQIAMAYQLYRDVEVAGLKVVINSVGDHRDRPAYGTSLTAYFASFRERLCGDCQKRLESNPLRILDCKVASCREIAKQAPSILDALHPDNAEHFCAVKELLTASGIPFEVDHRMVRGLDYYTGTVFEIMTDTGGLGAQNTLIAGGRYNSLIEKLGGDATPAVGWALGIERAMLAIDKPADDYRARPDLFIATRGQGSKAAATALAAEVRSAGRYVELEHRGVSLKSQFKRADKLGSRYIGVIGEDEVADNVIVMRDMRSKAEDRIPLSSAATWLADKLAP